MPVNFRRARTSNSPMNRLSLAERWMIFAGLVLVAYFALDATFSVRNVERLTVDSEAVGHTHRVAAAIERVMSDLKDAETGQRGYIITGNEEYLAPYSEVTARIEPDLDAVAALLQDPAQVSLVEQLRADARAKLAELDATIQTRRLAGFEAARAAVSTNIGKKQMDAMRVIGDTMMRREMALLRERQMAAADAARRTEMQIIVSDALGALAVIALLVVLRRHFLSRERDLAQIAAQRAELQAADRRKDEFLATLAHELRNPLAPMSNSLFILAQREAPQHARERALSTLQRQVRQMVKLIDDLLDVGRIRLGKLALAPRIVKLSEVVDQAVETVAPMVQASRHHLEIALPNDAVYLEADPIRLAQVISNLLNNAAKFTPPEGHIRLSAQVQDGSVCIEVRDNGPGIDPARIDDVFELFTQLDSPLERKNSGLGIGLALVRRLVELHGGTVSAHSEGAGRGAAFAVRLPTTAPPQLSLVGAAGQQAPARARRVLIADDNQDGAETLSTMVRLMGHDARVAHDGAAALRAGSETQPDLVILDIGMPGMNGYDTCAAMRNTAWGRNAVIVALTGWGQEADRRRAEAAGFDRHVVKPIGEETLRALFEDARPATERATAAAD